MFGTITLSEAPDAERVMDVLFEACMGAVFGMNPDTADAYDYPAYEHSIHDLGLVCYPPESQYWINHPETPPPFPWVAMCEN
jgi:hypothetical protein